MRALVELRALLADLAEVLAIAGIVYTLLAAWLMRRWARTPLPRAADPAPSLTMLKPLHGPEPDLAGKLQGFLDQDYAGAIEMVCGVSDGTDPAIAAAQIVGARLVVDATRHGANAKVSNLVNMTRHARGSVLVLSDSDMRAPPHYAATVAGALAEPGVGAVTLAYCGRGEAGGWSRLAAAGISWSFLPSVVVGVALGLATPCMGSTIALRRDLLDRLGGFARFADRLADDYAIGAAVRAEGLTVVMPALVVTHGCTETSLAALWAHELRWLVTVRGIDPAGFAGSAVTYPLGWAAVAWLLGGTPWLAAVAIGARLVLARTADRVAGERAAPLAWLPLRDLLSFATFWASFGRRRVAWRGARLDVDGERLLDAAPR